MGIACTSLAAAQSPLFLNVTEGTDNMNENTAGSKKSWHQCEHD